jgi:hypothetical protein
VAAGTGIGRRDQGEVGREPHAGHGPGDGDLTLFERLTQGLAGGPGELRQLVEEEDAVIPGGAANTTGNHGEELPGAT